MVQGAGLGLIVAIGLAAGAARADIVKVAAFDGDASEGFESMADTNLFMPGPVFGGLATIEAPIVNITSSWSLEGEVLPHSGIAFAGGIGGPVRYQFSTPVFAFGGSFAAASGISDGIATFYDPSGVLLGSDTISAPDPGPSSLAQWVWNGWRSDSPIAAIVLSSNAPWGEGLMQDDMQARTSSRTIPSPSGAGLATAAALGLLVRPRQRTSP